MTVVVERSFAVLVRLEAPTQEAAHEALKGLERRLAAAVPGRLDGLQVLSKSVQAAR
jgi:hypothetical protein